MKETKSIIDLGLAKKIIIVASWDVGLREYERIDETRELFRIKVPFVGRRNPFLAFIRYWSMAFRIFTKFDSKEIKIVNPHSLNVLPIGVLFKIFRGCRLVYDTHELETERNMLHGLAKKVSKVVEKICVRFVDHIIVVGPSIGKWYRDAYPGNKVTVIRNIPYLRSSIQSDLLRQEFSIGPGDLVYIYQGAFIPGRGIDLAIEVFKNFRDRHLVLMGYGPLKDFIMESANHHENIHVKDPVPPDRILQVTASADVGIIVAENCCLSYFFGLSNKLFEYIIADLPIIVNDYPDMKEVADHGKIGWAIDYSAKSLTELIASHTPEMIMEYKQRVKKVKGQYDWKLEEKHLLRIYHET
ncbi:MAG: glycosyltransferase family 4 protein [Cyclobacteriaceae bacterium]